MSVSPQNVFFFHAAFGIAHCPKAPTVLKPPATVAGQVSASEGDGPAPRFVSEWSAWLAAVATRAERHLVWLVQQRISIV
jgi:hypothetical protein